MTAAVVPLEVRIAQAQRAAAAGNIRMAELYTARALQLVALERADTRKAMGAATRNLRSHRMGQSLGGFMQGFAEILTEAIQPIRDAIIPTINAISDALASSAEDYVLSNDQRLLDAMYAVQAGEVLTADQRKFL